MNNQTFLYTRSNSSKAARYWSFSISVVALCLCAAAWVLLPTALKSAKARRPMPAGQFQADARTVYAAIEYLLDQDLSPGLPVATGGCNPSNFMFQPMGPSVVCGSLSNQMELPSDMATNPPTRS